MKPRARRLLHIVLTAGLCGATLLIGGGQAHADTVTLSDNGTSVTFHNQDGDWTIWKQCVVVSGVDMIGPGYIGRFVTKANITPVDGYGAGGGRQYTAASEAGLGIFGYTESRGDPSSGAWWDMSNRACAAENGGFGVKSVTTPGYGIDSTGHGYYDQDVLLGDGWVPDKQLWVRYHWRFDDSNVRLYTMVVQDCASGSCGTDSRTVFVKAPMFVNNFGNGQFSSTRPNHISTFTSDGKYIASTENNSKYPNDPKVWVQCSDLTDSTATNCVNAGYDCTWKPPANLNPTQSTAHCFYDSRARTRLDYGNGTIAAGCNTTSQLCFDIVARSYPVTNLDVPPGGSAFNWEGSGIGLDQWAVNAASDPAAGVAGCGIEGFTVTDPSAQLARDWEYPLTTTSGARSFASVSVFDKAWDNCSVGPNAPSLFRQLESWDKAYGAFFSYSINDGWTLQ
ncbi:MAG: hypothetical protein ACJ74U_06330 [Jatrophihabitantaceae bacterium]